MENSRLLTLAECCLKAKTFTAPAMVTQMRDLGVRVDYNYVSVVLRRWLAAERIDRLEYHGTRKGHPAVYAVKTLCLDNFRTRRPIEPAGAEPPYVVPPLSPTELAWREFRAEMDIP